MKFCGLDATNEVFIRETHSDIRGCQPNLVIPLWGEKLTGFATLMVGIMNSPWYMKGTFQLPSPCSCGIGLCFDWWMENLMFVPLSPEGKFLHLFMKKLCCYNVFENTCTSLNQNEILTIGIKLFSGQVWLWSNSPSFYISSVEDVSILIRMLPDRIVWCS